MEIKEVLLSEIKPDPNQPRKIVDNKSVENLAKSLKTEGLIHPIEIDTNNTIVVGEMRYRAAKSLGWETIRASINTNPLPAYERLRRQMAENLQQSGSKGGGQPMNSVDTAKAWAQLYFLKTGEKYVGATHFNTGRSVEGPLSQIADEVGVDKHTVWEYLQLLDEPKQVIDDLLAGRKRSYYTEANKVSKERQEPIKQAIIENKITNSKDIRKLAALEKSQPERAEIVFQQMIKKHSQEANQIMRKAIDLSLVLGKVNPDEFSEQDKAVVYGQLQSTVGAVGSFMGRMK